MPAIHLLKISRLEGLTDGIFAIAMTIMVLNLHVPDYAKIMPGAPDPIVNINLATSLLIYVGSFIILGTHWIAMNFQLGLLDHLNRVYLWANMYYLMVICIIPFSANFLGKYPESVHSIYFYAANCFCASIGQILVLESSHHFKLNKDKYTTVIRQATLRRILVAPPFYIGSVFMASWDIKLAFLMLVAPTLIYLFPGSIDRYEGV